MSRYSQRGVSAKKEDVHKALSGIDKGLFPGAFCKIIPDLLGDNPDYCNIMHADGAGTKSSLAYLYYKETGDISVFEGIAMDSIVMNIDDMICAGATGPFLLSSTIGRNARLIGGEIISALINANEKIAKMFTDNGVEVIMTGGETADVGDLVRTVIVDTTVTARLNKSDVIDFSKVKPGMVIVGLSSYGQATFEKEYNSGIGSNGLTSARHDIFSSIYKSKYPETYDLGIPEELAYSGGLLVTNKVDGIPINVGKAVLSPTRTYAFVIKDLLGEIRDRIGGIVHCSGGGQVKCIKFGNNLHYIKDNLMSMAPLFRLIIEKTGTPLEEAYRVFNMGHRMEVYTDETSADKVIKVAARYNIEAAIIGRIEYSEINKVTISDKSGFKYTYNL